MQRCRCWWFPRRNCSRTIMLASSLSILQRIPPVTQQKLFTILKKFWRSSSLFSGKSLIYEARVHIAPTLYRSVTLTTGLCSSFIRAKSSFFNLHWSKYPDPVCTDLGHEQASYMGRWSSCSLSILSPFWLRILRELNTRPFSPASHCLGPSRGCTTR